MPVDDLYWNAIDFGSDNESIHDPNSKHYVDPWDLENYAYIREHLDSIDLSSNPSGSSSGDGEFVGGSSSNGEFVEANSTSFYYVPAQNRKPSYNNRGKTTNNTQLIPPSIPEMRIDDGIKYDSLMTDQSNYVAIDELKIYERNRLRKELMDSYGPQERVARRHDYDTEIEENPYDDGLHYHMSERRYGKVIPPVGTTTRDRSLSFSYGDQSYYPEDRYEIYSKLDEYPMTRKDATLPIYDDERRNRRKPTNFGLSNYGHLKIDYSYSWNNLNKYISN